LWLSSSPLINFPYKNFQEIKKINKKLKNNFLIKNLFLMKRNNITINNNINNEYNIIKTKTIISDSKELYEILPHNIFVENIQDLRRHRLMFFNQVTNLSGSILLSWFQLSQRRYIRKTLAGRLYAIPKIYKEIKKIVCEKIIGEKNNLSIKPLYQTNKPISNLRGFDLTVGTINNICILWDIQEGVIFGRIKKIENNTNAIVEHYNIILPNKNKKDIIISKCTGCDRNQNIKGTFCSFISPVSFTFLVKTNTIERQLHNVILLTEVQYSDLFDIIYFNNYFKNHPNQYQHNDLRIIELRQQQQPPFYDLIKKYVEMSSDRNKLYFIMRNIQHMNNFIIYTDGSAKDLNTTNAMITFGTTFYNNNMQLLAEFASTTDYWLSVNKAELMALFVSLIVLPIGSISSIYTDSQFIVNTFYYLKTKQF
jgi:hypothetical protein